MPSLGKRDMKRPLRLVGRIVIGSDHRAKAPSAAVRIPAVFLKCRHAFIRLFQIQFFRKRREPKPHPSPAVSIFLRRIPQMPDHCIQLCRGFAFLIYLPFYSSPGSDLLPGQRDHDCRRFPPVLRIVVIFRAAVARLKLFIDLVAPHLQVSSARLGNISGVRLMQHVVAVLPVLYPEADPEFGISPDVFVHRTAGPLRCQD